MNKLLSQFKNEAPSRTPPVWFMRQAGRYLPEYREVRARFPNFLEMCLNTEITTELAMHPISRFDLDAGILFSDIMMLPHAIGVNVQFIEGRGPVLSEMFKDYSVDTFLSSSLSDAIMEKVHEAVKKLKNLMHKNNKATIGFSGAPWTLLCYMLEGESSKNFLRAVKIFYEDEKIAKKILNKLEDLIFQYVKAQIDAGADMIQLFDSHAALAPGSLFKTCIVEPTKKLVHRIKTYNPDIPIVGFAKGIDTLSSAQYGIECNLDGISLGDNVDIVKINDIARQNKKKLLLQGTLNNLLLSCDPKKVEKKIVKDITIQKEIAKSNNISMIFNTSHGLIPSTKIENVITTLNTVRQI